MLEVERRTALKKSALYALIKQKKFPSQVKVAGQTAFVESEVEDWIQARILERDQGAAMGVAEAMKNASASCVPAVSEPPSSRYEHHLNELERIRRENEMAEAE